MLMPFAPPRAPAGVTDLLGELPPDLFDEGLHTCCELVERYAVDLTLEIAAELRLAPALASGGTAAELAERLGFVTAFRPALDSLLARLEQAGEITAAGTPPVYRAAAPLRASEREALRAIGLDLAPHLAATLDLLDAAAAAHVAVAAGRSTGEQLLLAPASVGLWLAYFDNANRVYSISNELAAVAAANRLPERRGLRILEIGGGAGGASVSLLGELGRRGRLGDLARYDFTEPGPFFRRRAERELRARYPETPLAFRSFDIDLPAAAQAIEGDYDLVFGVNVVHVAQRLADTLRQLLDLLAPGGVLVAGECCRLLPGQSVPADLAFQLLSGFTAVETGVERPHHGFLQPVVWRRALESAGFERVEVVPDLDRVGEIYPRFYAGTLCGRRPCIQSHPEGNA